MGASIYLYAIRPWCVTTRTCMQWNAAIKWYLERIPVFRTTVWYRIAYYIILYWTIQSMPPLSPLGRSLCLSCLIPVCNTTAFSRYVPIANLFTPSFDGTGRLTTRIDYSFARIATKSLYSIRNVTHNNTTLSRRNPKDAQWCRVVCRSGLEGPG